MVRLGCLLFVVVEGTLWVVVVNWHTATQCLDVFSFCEFKKQMNVENRLPNTQSNAALVDGSCEVIDRNLPRGGAAGPRRAQRLMNRALPVEIN